MCIDHWLHCNSSFPHLVFLSLNGGVLVNFALFRLFLVLWACGIIWCDIAWCWLQLPSRIDLVFSCSFLFSSKNCGSSLKVIPEFIQYCAMIVQRLSQITQCATIKKNAAVKSSLFTWTDEKATIHLHDWTINIVRHI